MLRIILSAPVYMFVYVEKFKVFLFIEGTQPYPDAEYRTDLILTVQSRHRQPHAQWH